MISAIQGTIHDASCKSRGYFATDQKTSYIVLASSIIIDTHELWWENSERTALMNQSYGCSHVIDVKRYWWGVGVLVTNLNVSCIFVSRSFSHENRKTFIYIVPFCLLTVAIQYVELFKTSLRGSAFKLHSYSSVSFSSGYTTSIFYWSITNNSSPLYITLSFYWNFAPS